MKKNYICKYCNKPFSKDDCGKNPTFCCINCLNEYRIQMRKHYTCKNCGKEFIRSANDKNKTFCCLDCYKNYRSKNKIDYDKYKLEYCREYYMKNKEEFAKKSKERRDKNKKKYSKLSKDYNKKPSYRYNAYKRAAKARNIDFNITKEDFYDLWDMPCIYCGNEIDGIGVDRIDNTIGYEVLNIAPCCSWCNKMKLTETKEDFINHCKKIVNFNKEK